MEIRCQIIFIKHRFWKIHQLVTLGTMQRILQKITEEWSCARKHLVAFWYFHTFVCIANQPWTATKNSSREKIKGMLGQFKTRLDAFWYSYIPPYFFLKILFVVPKVSNWWIFQKRCFMKLIWHRISIQTLLFQDVFAYSSKWRRKPW